MKVPNIKKREDEEPNKAKYFNFDAEIKTDNNKHKTEPEKYSSLNFVIS